MGSTNYFRILKDLINLFLSLVCINYVPNQNGKVLEETLAGFNLDVVKATLRHLRYFKMALPPPKFFKISFHFSVTLPHATESITNGSLGQGITLSLVDCYFRALGLV